MDGASIIMAFAPYQAGGQQLRGFFQNLYSFGFLDFVLPTLLIFALLFGILQKVKLFQTKSKDGKDVSDKKINGLLSLIVALAVVLPHSLGRYPANMDPVIIIGKLLPGAAMMFAGILSLVLILGLVITDGTKISPMQSLIAVIAAVVLLLMFVMNVFPDLIPSWSFLRNPATQAALVVVLTIVVVVYFVMRPEGGEPLHKQVSWWIREKPEAPAGKS